MKGTGKSKSKTFAFTAPEEEDDHAMLVSTAAEAGFRPIRAAADDHEMRLWMGSDSSSDEEQIRSSRIRCSGRSAFIMFACIVLVAMVAIVAFNDGGEGISLNNSSGGKEEGKTPNNSDNDQGMTPDIYDNEEEEEQDSSADMVGYEDEYDPADGFEEGDDFPQEVYDYNVDDGSANLPSSNDVDSETKKDDSKSNEGEFVDERLPKDDTIEEYDEEHEKQDQPEVKKESGSETSSEEQSTGTSKPVKEGVSKGNETNSSNVEMKQDDDERIHHDKKEPSKQEQESEEDPEYYDHDDEPNSGAKVVQQQQEEEEDTRKKVQFPARIGGENPNCAVINRSSLMSKMCGHLSSEGDVPLLVTGAGRSGTLFTQRVLNRAGLLVSHDNTLGNHGSVSWHHAFWNGPIKDEKKGERSCAYDNTWGHNYEKTPLFKHVLQVVRNPLDNINSRFQKGSFNDAHGWSQSTQCNTAYMPGINKNLDDFHHKLALAIRHYVLWNSFISAHAEWGFQVEQLESPERVSVVKEVATRAGLQEFLESDSTIEEIDVLDEDRNVGHQNIQGISWKMLLDVDLEYASMAQILALQYGYPIAVEDLAAPIRNLLCPDETECSLEGKQPRLKCSMVVETGRWSCGRLSSKISNYFV